MSQQQMRPKYIWLLFCIPVFTAALHAQAETSRPNVVLVFIDDMGWADFSCFGNQAVQTEHIDRLAAEGIRFQQFYVNSPICSPSRVAISTGQYPTRWKITSYLASRELNDRRGISQWLSTDAPMLARQLQQAGYATGHFGKWHMGGQRDVGEAPLISEYGFHESLTNFEGLGPRVLAICDAHDGKPTRRHTLGSDSLGRGKITYVDRSLVTQSFTSAAIDFLKRAAKSDTPFYINVWPDDVHSPFFPPEVRRGDGSKRELYHGVLDTMDEQLGVLFDTIRADQKLRKNTLLLICSDNGPELGAGSAGNLRGYKTHLYEGGVRSSLIAWAPGLIDPARQGTVNSESVFSAMDLVPTVLKIANVDSKSDFDGEALPGTLLGRSNESRSAPLCFRRPPDRDAYYGDNDLPDLAIRDANWKLLCEYDGSEKELYDLSADPSEQTNLAKINPDVAERLAKHLVKWHNEMPADKGASFKKLPRKKR